MNFIHRKFITVLQIVLLLVDVAVIAHAAQQPAPPAHPASKPYVKMATGHKRDIFAVAFSPDGRWLAVLCSADRSVFL